MSQVLMCDRPGCGNMFSSRAKGYKQGVEVDSETNRQVSVDTCPDCAAEVESMRGDLVFRPRRFQPAIEDATPAADSEGNI